MISGPVARFDYRGIPIAIEGIAKDDLIFAAIASRASFYEDDLLEYMRAVLGTDNGCIVDVGSNIGNHAVYFGRFLADLVIAIEVNHLVISTLRRNLERNEIRHSIYEVGVGAERGQATIELPAEHVANIGATRLRLDDAGHVAITTLDSLLAEIEARSRDGHITAIKLDIEGMEPMALHGGTRMLATHLPELFVEIMNDDKLRQVESILGPLGYMRIVAHASTPVWHFTHRRNLSMRRILRITSFLLVARLSRLGRRIIRRLRRHQ